MRLLPLLSKLRSLGKSLALCLGGLPRDLEACLDGLDGRGRTRGVGKGWLLRRRRPQLLLLLLLEILGRRQQLLLLLLVLRLQALLLLLLRQHPTLPLPRPHQRLLPSPVQPQEPLLPLLWHGASLALRALLSRPLLATPASPLRDHGVSLRRRELNLRQLLTWRGGRVGRVRREGGGGGGEDAGERLREDRLRRAEEVRLSRHGERVLRVCGL